jgi:hypothetical protein
MLSTWRRGRHQNRPETLGRREGARWLGAMVLRELAVAQRGLRRSATRGAWEKKLERLPRLLAQQRWLAQHMEPRSMRRKEEKQREWHGAG